MIFFVSMVPKIFLPAKFWFDLTNIYGITDQYTNTNIKLDLRQRILNKTVKDQCFGVSVVIDKRVAFCTCKYPLSNIFNPS